MEKPLLHMDHLKQRFFILKYVTVYVHTFSLSHVSPVIIDVYLFIEDTSLSDDHLKAPEWRTWFIDQVIVASL